MAKQFTTEWYGPLGSQRPGRQGGLHNSSCPLPTNQSQNATSFFFPATRVLVQIIKPHSLINKLCTRPKATDFFNNMLSIRIAINVLPTNAKSSIEQ